jgi:hypothetical protein
MHRAWLIGWLWLAGGVLPQTASAEETPRPFEIGLGPHAGVTFGDMCSGHGDVYGCTNGAVFAGVQLAPRWRLSHAWSIGAIGSGADGSGTMDDASQTWWRAEAEARVHPFELASPDLAFGVDAGMIAVFDRGSDPARSISHVAPALGAACALDFAITPAFALGGELRVFTWLFADGNEIDTQAHYGTQLGLSLAVTGTIRAGD